MPSLLVCEKRFSTIFTSADKSYLTYPYPTRFVDKIRISTRVVNTRVKTVADVITTSIFNMADVNVWERDSLMATPALKLNAEDQKVSVMVVWCG